MTVSGHTQVGSSILFRHLGIKRLWLQSVPAGPSAPYRRLAAWAAPRLLGAASLSVMLRAIAMPEEGHYFPMAIQKGLCAAAGAPRRTADVRDDAACARHVLQGEVSRTRGILNIRSDRAEHGRDFYLLFRRAWHPPAPRQHMLADLLNFQPDSPVVLGDAAVAQALADCLARHCWAVGRYVRAPQAAARR